MQWLVEHAKKTPPHKPALVLHRYLLLKQSTDGEILRALPESRVLFGPWEVAAAIKRHMENKVELFSEGSWDLFYGDGFMVRTYFHHGRKARRISGWSPNIVTWNPGVHILVGSRP
ncbi:MAG TPA: hypothetical protein VM103_01130 [Candidatus Paceibacterota bacterium]|nr:hypothetical protein [Candidatus Paceibacterota bacterium]